MTRAVPLLSCIFSAPVAAQTAGHLRGARVAVEDRLPVCFGFPYVDNDCGYAEFGCFPDLRCLDAATYGCTEATEHPDWEVCKVCAKPGDPNAAGYDECPTEPVKPGPSLPVCFGFPYVDNDCGYAEFGCYPDLRCLDAATYGCTEATKHPDWEVCRVCSKPGDPNAAGYEECPTEPVQPLPPPPPAPSPSLPVCFGFPYVDNDCGYAEFGCFPDLRCLDAATYGCTEATEHPDWEVCRVCAKPGESNAAGYDECPTELVKPGPSLPVCFGFPYVDNDCGYAEFGCFPDLRCLDAATYGCTEATKHPDWEVCKVCSKPGDPNAAGYEECPTEPVQPLPAV